VLDKKRIEEAEVGEFKRRNEIKEQRSNYHSIRKEEKAKKRSLNIEIASELIDLIMDLQDEVFEK